MKRAAFICTVLLVIGSLAGCGSAGRRTESAFKTSFSLGAIVEANKGSLMAGSRISSGTEAGPPEPFVQKHEGMIVQVDPAHASAFMDGVRATVEESLIRSGARILGRGRDAKANCRARNLADDHLDVRSNVDWLIALESDY